MTETRRRFFGNALRIVAIVTTVPLWLNSGSALATIQYLDDGAVQNNLNGWDLPTQGTCPAGGLNGYSGIDTRPECTALRLNIVQASCVSPNYSFTTNGVCNDLVNTTQASCLAAGDRLWNPGTNLCSVVMVNDDRNDVTCVLHGGTWVTTGTCTGSWVFQSRSSFTPALLTGTGPGDQCLRCHNTLTQYNSPRVRDTEDTLYMGHKNMARKVTAPLAWGGPPIACSNPTYTTEEDCIHNGGEWLPISPYPSDDAGNVFDWPNGRINVGVNSYDLTWIYGDWLGPLPRTVYKAPASTTSKTCTDPRYTTQTTCESNGGAWVFNTGSTYSCGRCHTTGWTSDAAIKPSTGIEAKEPEASFPGITWDRLSDAPANVVNLSGGVTGDPNKYSSWDVYGISCTRCHNSAIDTTKGDASTPPQYSAPTGMSTHHSNLTSTDINSGACTDPRWTAEAQCTAGGGTWMTACSVNPTAAVCTNAATTSAACAGTTSGTWVSAPAWCSNAFYNDQTSCTTNGFTWQDGWCQRADITTQAACTGGSGANALSWRLNGTQASCMIAGATWSFTECSVEGACNVGTCSNPSFPNAVNCRANGGTWTPITTPAACAVASGQFRYATDVIRCEDAGGRWTGNNTNRGPIITALCMNCHRQETGGLPFGATSTDGVNVDYSATDPAGQLKVGPYHSTVTFLSHPHGNQFLNSPHGKFTGKFNEIATGKFNFAMTGLYKSFFQIDDEAANTGNGCTGCHEVHTSTVTGEKPFRAECKECHSGSHDIDLKKINHLSGVGTPLEKMNAEPSEPCIVCHMPGGKHLFRINPDPNYSTFPIPAALTANANANTAPDGTFTNAVWVDVDGACGQCHGGGTAHAETTGTIATGSKVLTVASTAGFLANERITIADAGNFVYEDSGPIRGDFETYIVSVAPPSTINLAGTAPIGVAGKTVVQNALRNDAHYYTKADLAQVAKGIHNSSGVVFPVTFTAAKVPNSLDVDVDATVDCGGACPPLAYDWNWGDSTADGTGATSAHTYATGGTFTITLTVNMISNGLGVGSYSRNVSLTVPDLPPVASGTCTWNQNALTMSVTDTSTDDGPDANGTTGDGDAALKATIDWGDGSGKTLVKHTPGPASASHTYTRTGTFPVRILVIDSALQSSVWNCPTSATPSRFTISGTVFKTGGTVPLAYATVKVKKGSTIIKSMVTAVDGTFSTGATLKPGTYTLKVVKTGYTFPAPLTIPLGPDSTGNVIVATGP